MYHFQFCRFVRSLLILYFSLIYNGSVLCQFIETYLYFKLYILYDVKQNMFLSGLVKKLNFAVCLEI
jgi:hypothetical protein